jgi:hypothetical protein
MYYWPCKGAQDKAKPWGMWAFVLSRAFVLTKTVSLKHLKI